MDHKVRVYYAGKFTYKKEYLKDEDGKDMIFDSQQAARDYLHNLGYQEGSNGTFTGIYFDPIVGPADPDMMDEKAVMNLMYEITEAACKDYIANMNSSHGEDPGTRMEIEHYFHGALFDAAYDVDGDYVIQTLRKQRKPQTSSRKTANYYYDADAVKQDIENNMPVREIMSKHNISKYTVGRIKKGMRNDDKE